MPQLQKAKGLRMGQSEFVYLEFFPEPRHFVLALDSRRAVAVLEKPQGAQVVEKAKPWLLYLRSHFKGKRVFRVWEPSEDKVEWHFDLDGRWKWLWEFQASQMVWHFVIPTREAPFTVTLECPDLSRLAPGDEARSAVSLGSTAHAREPNRKFLKLIDNLQNDLKSAEGWLDSHQALIRALEGNPKLWGRVPRQDMESAFGATFAEELARGKWPAWRPELAAQANSLVFEARRRMERKKLAVTARINKIKTEAANAPEFEAPKPVPLVDEGRPKGPQKKPGLWIPLASGAWARVGRNARENDELYRQASDRDYWFHVRSLPGSHVWIPRGQPGLGAKDEISADWVQKGAELAVWNSKLALGSSVEVDWTEKRYLRSRRGVPGALEVHRSKTFFVRWTDERFQHWKAWLASHRV